MTETWEGYVKNPRRILDAALRRAGNLLHRYRLPKGPARYLSAYAAEEVPVPVDANGSERPSGPLYSVWQQIPNGHKWWHYFPAYEGVLNPLRSRPIRMLEVGVYRGGSLEMWKRYLHPGSTIVGLDIDPNCTAFDRPSEGVHVRIGSQADADFLKRVVGEFGKFDVIIDDGSHLASHMIKTFDFLFLNGLVDRGTYIVEDTHTNFWPSYRDQNYSFVDLCKDLVDLTHAHYVKNRAILRFRTGDAGRISATAVTRIASQIDELRFLDSMVVITRRENKFLPTVEHL